jgi:hypothetical protein
MRVTELVPLLPIPSTTTPTERRLLGSSRTWGALLCVISTDLGAGLL